jgi:hypothetical protein
MLDKKTKEDIMSDEVYRKTAEVLNTLPNGFPPTESGVEIKLLKKFLSRTKPRFSAD